MKKIKVKITAFNRYLISFRNSIIKNLISFRNSIIKNLISFRNSIVKNLISFINSIVNKRKSFRFSIEIKNFIIKQLRLIRFTLEIKKLLFFFIRLEFMKNIKFKTSVFSRYLISLIFFLFSYLFYLSIPVFYNYGDLQKDITTKLLKEFNLNAALSANITYKILPSPNFEISNVILSTDLDKKFNEFAQIKKLKIYVSIRELYSQKKLEIKKIIFSEANFNVNKNSFYYINEFFRKKSSSKKIIIKKSKIFFRKNVDKKDAIALSSIQTSKIFYDKEKNSNIIIIDGSIFNTRYNLSFSRSIANQSSTNFKISFKQLNAQINNEFLKSSEKSINSEGIVSIIFSGFENIINYEISDEFILFSSDKISIDDQRTFFNGKVNISPFYYNIYVDLDSMNVIKFIRNFSKIQNLLQNKILLNKNFNGKIIFDIHSLPGIKLFDRAKINLEIMNGKLMLNNTTVTSEKIGKIFFLDSVIQEKNDKKFFKSKFLFDIIYQKKFYQELQVPKSNRIKLSNIYLEIEQDLEVGDFKINKFIFNKKLKNNLEDKTKDLTNLLNTNEINNVKNWIELKKLLNQIFSEIN